MAYSYSEEPSPCAPRLFLPLDGADPRIHLDKQFSRVGSDRVVEITFGVR